MRCVTISRVRIIEMGDLQVSPMLAPGEDLRFIFRAANGVGWNSSRGALETHVGVSGAAMALRRIIEAARSEYGIHLVTDAATEWMAVSPAMREQLEKTMAGGAGSRGHPVIDRG